MADPLKSVKDTLQSLKSTIIKTQTSDIDARLDNAVKDIISYRANSGRNGYIELVRSLISKTADVKISGVGGGLFAQGISPAAFGQGSRMLRYRTYQAIISQINWAFRALNVLVDNILSPDDITKTALEIKPKAYLEDETPTASKTRYVQEVSKSLSIDDKLDVIVRNTLLFGDLFCEIGGPKEALTSRTLLSEARDYELIIDNQREGGYRDIIREDIEGKEYNITVDYSSLMEVADQEEKDSKRKKDKNPIRKGNKVLTNLKLIFHHPQFVVKLQSALFPICFGYLVFPAVLLFPGAMLADEAVNNICMAILKSLENKLPQMKEFKNDNDLRDIIKIMLANTNFNRAVNIRYVAPEKMVHFQVPSAKYYPYGESVFDSTQFTAKVLTALETALAIQRLSRSTEKRKVAIEIGLPRDARKAIEAMKEEFRKRKISLDSFGTVDTIPSMITTFEDVYIPQKDGKPFVDISTFDEGRVDLRSKTDELKFLRDQLVASLGIPPSFIGIEENLSNKAALSEENILFARTVIGHQKYLTRQLNDLFQKIFNIINPEEALTILDNVLITLPIPKSLQFERESRYMSEISSLIQSLESIGIPREYAKRRYLSSIDWNEVEKYKIDQKIDETLDPEEKAQTTGMGGLGGMGGMGGLGGGGITV